MLEFVKIIIGAKIDRGEKGATAVEYGLMVALIAVAIIAAVTLVGTKMTTMFNDIAALV